MNHLKFCFVVEDLLENFVIWKKKAYFEIRCDFGVKNFVGVKGLRFVLLVGSSFPCIFLYCDLGK
jgi:hypothetical protein